MLVSGVLHALMWVLHGIVAAFPVADLSWLQTLAAKVGDALGIMWSVNAYVPIAETIAAVGVFMGIWIVITVVVAVRKLWSLVAGGGGV